MTTKKRKRTRDMNVKEYINRLDERNVPLQLRPELIARFTEKRKLQSKFKRVRNSRRDAWGDVLAPLRLEYDYIKTRLHQMQKVERTPQTQANLESYRPVYTEYLELLAKTRDLLKLKQRLSSVTPAQAMLDKLGEELYAAHNQKGDFRYGTFWVDWIDAYTKNDLLRKQAALHYERRPLVPFFRRGDAIKKRNLDQHNKTRAAWKEELNRMLDKLDRTPADEQDPHLVWQAAKIEKAIERLDALPLTKRAPIRWRSMLHATDYDPTENLRGDEYSEDC